MFESRPQFTQSLVSVYITKGIYFKNFTPQYFFCMLINNETLKHFQESNALKFKEAKYQIFSIKTKREGGDKVDSKAASYISDSFAQT